MALVAGLPLLLMPALAMGQCGDRKCGETKISSTSSRCGETGRCGETVIRTSDSRCGEKACGEKVIHTSSSTCGEAQCPEVKRTNSICSFLGSLCGKKSKCAQPCGEVRCEEACEVKCETKRLDVDIERLRAHNPECTAELCVEYQVDIDDACPTEQFDLVLQVWNCNEVIWSKTVALEIPDGVTYDKDTVYTGSLTDTLPSVITERKNFRIEGHVFHRGTGMVAMDGNGWGSSIDSLDRETDRVRTSDSRGFVGTVTHTAMTPVRWTGRALGF